MKSVWYSIRAFTTVFAMVAFGLTLVVVIILGAIGKADREMALMALVALVGFLYAIKDAYFASTTGSNGQPHAPTT